MRSGLSSDPPGTWDRGGPASGKKNSRPERRFFTIGPPPAMALSAFGGLQCILFAALVCWRRVSIPSSSSSRCWASPG